MKKIVFVALAIAVLNASCQHMDGSGNIVTETRHTGNFTGIDAGGSFEVEVKNGPSTEITVEADDNIIKDIETEVAGNTLNIKLKNGFSFSNGHFKVFVTAPNINTLKSSGAATINIKNVVKNDDKITLEASGASSINGEINSPETSVDASGAAGVHVTGRTQKYAVEASGSSNVKTVGLMSETTKVNSSGAASVGVYSSISITVDASGASNVQYSGAGNTVIKTSGAGSATKN